jgi:hypothetical protein
MDAAIAGAKLKRRLIRAVDRVARRAEYRSMRRPALFLALLLAFGAATSARADQVRFTGATSVDAVVIRDALQNILQVAAARGCNRLEAVEASLLPADYRPAGSNDHAERPGLRYERWNATLCGHILPVLLGFWTAPQGGTMFQITIPYPADAPDPAPAS